MDELFDCDVDDNASDSLQSHAGACGGVADLRTDSSTAQEQTTRSEDTDGTEPRSACCNDEDVSVAHSLPVSIPQQMLGKGGFKDSAVKADTFVPPHQLSLHSSHIQQSVPLSSSSRLRTRNKLLQSTGFLPSACTEGFIVSGQSGDSLSRTQSDGRMLRSMPAESELLEAQSEPLLPITNSSNASNIQFLRSASKVSIPASIAEILG